MKFKFFIFKIFNKSFVDIAKEVKDEKLPAFTMQVKAITRGNEEKSQADQIKASEKAREMAIKDNRKNQEVEDIINFWKDKLHSTLCLLPRESSLWISEKCKEQSAGRKRKLKTRKMRKNATKLTRKSR